MKTTKEMIAVMQSYEEGKAIEFRILGSINWNDWNPAPAPTWDWSSRDYRVKPGPVYVPYTNAEDILADSKIHGPYVKFKNESSFRILFLVDGSASQVCGDIVTSNKSLLEQIYWQDGHLFGKLKE